MVPKSLLIVCTSAALFSTFAVISGGGGCSYNLTYHQSPQWCQKACSLSARLQIFSSFCWHLGGGGLHLLFSKVLLEQLGVGGVAVSSLKRAHPGSVCVQMSTLLEELSCIKQLHGAGDLTDEEYHTQVNQLKTWAAAVGWSCPMGAPQLLEFRSQELVIPFGEVTSVSNDVHPDTVTTASEQHAAQEDIEDPHVWTNKFVEHCLSQTASGSSVAGNLETVLQHPLNEGYSFAVIDGGKSFVCLLQCCPKNNTNPKRCGRSFTNLKAHLDCRQHWSRHMELAGGEVSDQAWSELSTGNKYSLRHSRTSQHANALFRKGPAAPQGSSEGSPSARKKPKIARPSNAAVGTPPSAPPSGLDGWVDVMQEMTHNTPKTY